ncbi:MAG: hypothetical protein LBT80_07560 [Lactobacillaceae bacterium]|jgi:hypothetical protein|nr:hypothetical protein [Lactobacillaceae bacterium]
MYNNPEDKSYMGDREFEKVTKLYIDAVEKARTIYPEFKRITIFINTVTAIMLLGILVAVLTVLREALGERDWTFNYLIVGILILIIEIIMIRKNHALFMNPPTTIAREDVELVSDPNIKIMNVIQMVKDDDYTIGVTQARGFKKMRRYFVFRRRDNIEVIDDKNLRYFNAVQSKWRTRVNAKLHYIDATELQQISSKKSNFSRGVIGNRLDETEIEKIKQAYNDTVAKAWDTYHIFKFWRIWNNVCSIIVVFGILYAIYYVILRARFNLNWASDYFMMLIFMGLFIKLRMNHSTWLNKNPDINHENVELLVDPKIWIYRVSQVVKTNEYTIFVSIDKAGLLRRRKKTYFIYRRLDNIEAVDAKSQRFNDTIQMKWKTRFFKHFHYIDVEKM